MAVLWGEDTQRGYCVTAGNGTFGRRLFAWFAASICIGSLVLSEENNVLMTEYRIASLMVPYQYLNINHRKSSNRTELSLY